MSPSWPGRNNFSGLMLSRSVVPGKIRFGSGFACCAGLLLLNTTRFYGSSKSPSGGELVFANLKLDRMLSRNSCARPRHARQGWQIGPCATFSRLAERAREQERRPRARRACPSIWISGPYIRGLAHARAACAAPSPIYGHHGRGIADTPH